MTLEIFFQLQERFGIFSSLIHLWTMKGRVHWRAQFLMKEISSFFPLLLHLCRPTSLHTLPHHIIDLLMSSFLFLPLLKIHIQRSLSNTHIYYISSADVLSISQTFSPNHYLRCPIDLLSHKLAWWVWLPYGVISLYLFAFWETEYFPCSTIDFLWL